MNEIGDLTPDLQPRLLRGLSTEMAGSPGQIGDDALSLLLEYDWPGNIRELRNVLERALIFAAGSEEILPKHLPPEIRNHAANDLGIARTTSIQKIKKYGLEV